MTDIPIEQALLGPPGVDGPELVARSPGFLDDWLPAARRLCAGFGEPSPGVTCAAAVFAQPFGKRHVAVVQAADTADRGADRPGQFMYRFLIIPRPAYRTLMGDPFAVAERFPPPWAARGELPTLAWPVEPPPLRTVAEVRQVLQRDEGPALLGGAQVLVDGGRVVFERPGPEPGLVRGLWALLPATTRCDLWPASFAFSNTLRFDAMVVPQGQGAAFAGYVNEEQAGNYPEGRYELNVQIAAEAGDQAELNALFARRSRAQTWRMGLLLLATVTLVALGSQVLLPPPPAPREGPARVTAKEPAATKATHKAAQ
jgi:hypothetical protein